MRFFFVCFMFVFTFSLCFSLSSFLFFSSVFLSVVARFVFLVIF